MQRRSAGWPTSAIPMCCRMRMTGPASGGCGNGSTTRAGARGRRSSGSPPTVRSLATWTAGKSPRTLDGMWKAVLRMLLGDVGPMLQLVLQTITDRHTLDHVIDLAQSAVAKLEGRDDLDGPAKRQAAFN